MCPKPDVRTTQVADANPDWQQLDLADSPLPPELLHSPESSRVTIAVYAVGEGRCTGGEDEVSAKGAGSGEAAGFDGDGPCGGRCCGAGDSSGTWEQSSAGRGSETAAASTPQAAQLNGGGATSRSVAAAARSHHMSERGTSHNRALTVR